MISNNFLICGLYVSLERNTNTYSSSRGYFYALSLALTSSLKTCSLSSSISYQFGALAMVYVLKLDFVSTMTSDTIILRDVALALISVLKPIVF